MSVFLGIDGGGTRTRAFVTDEFGHRGSWGQAGLSNPNHASVSQLRDNLLQATQTALAKLELTAADCSSVFVGLAGVTTQSGREQIQKLMRGAGFEHAQVGVDHDIRIALAGGLAMKPGIALIVGTGSSCYGRTGDGRTWQTGGWEALISDEGSGFFLAREAIAAAARMADGRTPETALREAVFRWLGIGQIAEILSRMQDGRLSRGDIAAFAPEVIALAEAGDGVAGQILETGAFLLAELVRANHRMLPTGPGPDVVITGGVGTAPGMYREKIVAAIGQALESVKIHPPLLQPAVGAALLARQQSGRPVSDALIEKLRGIPP